MKKLTWQSPITWVLAGVVIMVIGGIIGSLDDNDGGTNPLVAVGGIFFLIGAFTWAIRRGLSASERKRTP